MANYSFSKLAVDDINVIWNYTYEQWSEKQADQYYNELIKKCEMLANHPKIGREYFKLFINLRGFKVNKHIIFYRQIDQSSIEIDRILHERMDLKTRLRK